MRICLYTMHNEDTLGAMAAITMSNKIGYCAKHGYALHWESWTQEMFPGWERLPVLIYLLKCGHYDWVFWLGTDCLITNYRIKLEYLCDASYGMVIATDCTQIQADSFLIQRGNRGLRFIQEVWKIGKPVDPFEEQGVMDMLSKRAEYKPYIKLLPQRALNSYHYEWIGNGTGGMSRQTKDQMGNYGQWQPGDFVFHIPGQPHWDKMKALRAMQNEVMR